MAQDTTTGLEKSAERRQHFDIYALVEAPQELYFGHETSVNVNLVETVKIDGGDGTVDEKCYMSPTKRRGVERRSLIWSPLADGRLLGDKLGCGVPHTCARQDCPICSIMGALIVSKVEVDKSLPGGKTRNPTTFIGRLVHGGGVAVQSLAPEEKQRAMHPSMLHKAPEEKPTPTPFKREYNEPALLYPLYNHAMSVSEREFSAAAYAFLESLKRLGAGNPKGVRLYEVDDEPLLVLDRYIAPQGKRPVISPSINNKEKAIEEFQRRTHSLDAISRREIYKGDLFTRWTGDAALAQLQTYAARFAADHLL